MNRVVIVTGGTSGIGKACVKEFKDAGDIVYNLSRTADENSEYEIVCDVANEKEVKKAIDKIAEKHKKINIVINNAGMGISGALEFAKMDEVKKMFDVNVFGVMNITKACLPYMQRGDRFINISSTLGYFTVPYRSVYSATKSALNMLSYGLKMECRDFGVQVCLICPGEIKTNFSKSRLVSYETSERYGDKIKKAGERIEHNYEKRKPPETVSKIALKQANKKQCKTIIFTEKKFRLLYFVSKFLPMGFFLNLIEKFMGGHKKV